MNAATRPSPAANDRHTFLPGLPGAHGYLVPRDAWQAPRAVHVDAPTFAVHFEPSKDGEDEESDDRPTEPCPPPDEDDRPTPILPPVLRPSWVAPLRRALGRDWLRGRP